MYSAPMAASSRNKVICAACRARKKKCDGEQPACSPCRKRNVLCTYTSPVPGLGPDVSWNTPYPPAPFSSPLPAWSVIPATSFAAPNFAAATSIHDALFDSFIIPQFPQELDADPWNSVQAPTPTSDFTHQTPANNPITTTSIQFPPHPKLIELVELFFDRIHCYLPILHRQSYLRSVSTHGAVGSNRLLLFSVIASAAYAHPDPEIRASRQRWYEEAKTLYEQTSHKPDHALETLQAAACIALQALTHGEHSTAVLVVGKAARQATTIGLHQSDSPTRLVLSGVTLPTTDDWCQAEQRRRVIWALFILDRGICFPVGLPHAIDDRHLRLCLPMAEDLFQGSEAPPEPSETVFFSHDLKRLIAALRDEARRKSHNPSHYLILAYLLLGHIVGHMFSPDYNQDDAARRSERDELEQHLTQTRLMLPRCATDLAAARYQDFKYVVWLNVLMNVNTVLLHHQPQRGGIEVADEAAPGIADDGGSSSWQHCVAAAHNTALLVREACRVSTDLLMNPHVSAPIFTCSRILVVEYLLSSAKGQRQQRSPALRSDLEVMMLMFDRLHEVYGGVFQKFRVGLLYHLHQEEYCVRAVKACGSRGLLRCCGDWPTLQDVDGLGIPD
ncbi:fungal-specific transcription factor domain-containing protein [Lasiosphaeria hispida]|uniref:Fungal-specific transcription factor domain-containing protein n=1 Tax=Lasiosphaeria hispida TaxID=260671 RepID=A0AAJ0MIK4_9PEZI|nr:fungal-specific transcription factor domain-containing protein [Lasiosphaeria hispida]